MQREFFNQQMDRLRQCFGQNAYPPVRADLLWERFQNRPPQNLKSAIDHLILNCRTTPLLPEFFQAFDEAEKKLSNRPVPGSPFDNGRRGPCSTCGGVGYFYSPNPTEGVRAAVPCAHCPAGEPFRQAAQDRTRREQARSQVAVERTQLPTRMGETPVDRRSRASGND